MGKTGLSSITLYCLSGMEKSPRRPLGHCHVTIPLSYEYLELSPGDLVQKSLGCSIPEITYRNHMMKKGMKSLIFDFYGLH